MMAAIRAAAMTIQMVRRVVTRTLFIVVNRRAPTRQPCTDRFKWADRWTFFANAILCGRGDSNPHVLSDTGT